MAHSRFAKRSEHFDSSNTATHRHLAEFHSKNHEPLARLREPFPNARQGSRNGGYNQRLESAVLHQTDRTEDSCQFVACALIPFFQFWPASSDGGRPVPPCRG